MASSRLPPERRSIRSAINCPSGGEVLPAASFPSCRSCSSARSWMAESGVPAEVAEACLAHVPRSRVVQAYQRSDLLERRGHAGVE